jgi:hypothetical protein
MAKCEREQGRQFSAVLCPMLTTNRTFSGQRRNAVNDPEPILAGAKFRSAAVLCYPFRRKHGNYLSYTFRKSPVAHDCVVADAVSIEPVSNSNSLLTGKNTGNFADSGPALQFQRPVSE